MNKKSGNVTYKDVDRGYFEKRGLKRYAGVWSLWALGVGAVISGDFFGWNFGLHAGGFGGLAIATAIMRCGHVHWPVLLHCRNESCTTAYWRRLFVWKNGYGPMGRICDRIG